MRAAMDTEVPQSSGPRRPLGRRHVVGLLLLSVLSAACVGAAVLTGSGARTITYVDSVPPDMPAETTAGRLVLHSERDANGVTWQAVKSDSSDGLCIDIQAFSASTGEPLGVVGGCGLGDMVFDAEGGFRSVRADHVLVPAIGRLRTTMGSRSVINTLVFGVSSCQCTVRVSFSNGTTLARRAAKGFFVMHVARAMDVERVEAVDADGHVLATHVVSPVPVSLSR